ncbi:probable LRR receptor-like serine/threonine-protein kinase At3g47570 [Eucalyptus grandis]|uniref:probable LRR receptor-like serine/threonine-protein kinase At3g47570 n=1 Tax=Eucalyptus grandis TaxID=71139 RepID=UPI00192EAD76|nr:probable LRR receptor-like serine/threonine-protein kinase At3g47570 [Eucalyptus grandis]
MGKQLFLMLNSVLLWWWSSIPSPGACSQNQTDWLALASFRDAIHEDPFGVFNSWNDSAHHCEWQGVSCSKRHPGRVTSLVLRSQGLGGFLSPQIGNLSFLRVMGLQNNSFRGKIPPQIGNLLRLRDLILSNNSFSGPIPSNLSHFPNLEILNLVDNQLVGGIHSNLGSLQRLESLGLSMNYLVGPIPPSIGNLSLLVLLSMAFNSLHGEIPEELSRLKRLAFFQISFNKLTGEISPGIFNISSINYFQVMGNQLRGCFPSDIGTSLPSLQYILVEDNLFTGLIPSSLTNATGLRALFLRNNSFHGPIPKNWGRLKGLYAIQLGWNQLQDDLSFISSLANCSHLKTLAVESNLIHGSFPRSISNLSTSINRIGMSDNHIQGTIPSSLGNLFNLLHLNLQNNFLTDDLPDSIGALYNLQQLSFAGNMFTGDIPSSIDFLLLKYLNMSFNELEGQVPEGGVFLNASAVSISGNRQLCGGIMGLKLPLCKSPSSNKYSSTKAIVIFAVAVSSLCLALLFLSIFYYCRKKQTTTNALTSSSFEHQFLRISYEELLRATDRFSETNVIGKGRYGTIYKGILDGYATVAVKVLNLMQRGALRSFVSECRTLGIIRHRNLVKILSVCSSVDFCGNDFKALIYEFMTNESLEEWLHPGTIGRDDECRESRNLTLVQRLNIAIDIATAIEYLHKDCYPVIVHGDLKPSNVLLDNDMMARVGDFGLAKITSTVSTEANGVQDQGSSTSTAVRGSIGYVPPEYGMGHEVSTLGDSYSYGILLLEMFTGKRPTEKVFGDHLNLHNFVRLALPDRAWEIVDFRLWSEAGDQHQEIKIRNCIISVFKVGVACSMESPLDRMDMTKAIRKLHLIKVSYETNERRIGT